MYKVMIVDDEMLARVGIKSMIEWKQHGFEVIGEAENGQKALLLAEQLRPDIIITDIKMPVLDGVELIKQLEQRQYGIQYIVLSAYDDFAYVKEAMKAGAEDYLIKLELQPDQLLSALDTIRLKLEEKRTSDSSNDQELNQNRNQMILRDTLLREIMEGRSYSDQEIRNRLPPGDMAVFEQAFVCYVIQPDRFEIYDKYTEDDVHLLDYAMQNVIEEVIFARAKGIVLSTSEREISVFVTYAQPESTSTCQEERGKVVEIAIKTALKTYLNTSVVIGVSNVHTSCANVRQSYKEAALAVDRRFSYPPGSTIHYGETSSWKVQPIDLSQELKEFEQLLAIADEAAIGSLMSRMNHKLKHAQLSRDSVKGFCTALLYVADAAMMKQNIHYSTAWKERVTAKVNQLGSLADFDKWIFEFEQGLKEALFDSNDTSKLIRNIKQYIASHYAEDVHLELLASQMNLSANYISHVFKRETNMTIVEYLTQWRVDQAIQLLQATDKKIYEIGQLVGYENEHYFSRVFKKVIGVSPNRFKK